MGQPRGPTLSLLKLVWKSKWARDGLSRPPDSSLAGFKQKCTGGCRFKTLVPTVDAGFLPGFWWINILQPSFPRCTLNGLSDLRGLTRFMVHFYMAFLCRWMADSTYRSPSERSKLKLEKATCCEHCSVGCMHDIFDVRLCNCPPFFRAITRMDQLDHL